MISVVTPTYFRYKEIPELLENLNKQEVLPGEIIIVDGAPIEEKRTEEWVNKHLNDFNFEVKYYRKTGGTAIQRNYGISQATCELIAFIDDDVRLEASFLKEILKHFQFDTLNEIGGITGYKLGHSFKMSERARWRWYKRFGLLHTFKPSAYDRDCGYPINAGAHPPFQGVREVDILTSACTVYRAEVFIKNHLSFHPFFRDYGMLEDNHLALSVQKKGYKNYQCGDAHCHELNSSSGRSNQEIIGFKTCVNYYFVFNSICGPLSFRKKCNFFRFQFFELFRFFISVLRRPNKSSLSLFRGKVLGIIVSLFYWNSYCNKILEQE